MITLFYIIINDGNNVIRHKVNNKVDGVKVLCSTRYKIGHSGDILPSQFLGLVLKKN